MTGTERDVEVPTRVYEALVTGDLRHDLRRIEGTPFAPGDVLRYREVDGSGLRTGWVARAHVSYVTWAGNQCALSPAGLAPGHAILSLDEVAVLPQGAA